MKTNNKIMIPQSRYDMLCQQDGRIIAAQSFVDNSLIICVDDLCNIIGIDMTIYKNRQAELHKSHIENLKSGEAND